MLMVLLGAVEIGVATAFNTRPNVQSFTISEIYKTFPNTCILFRFESVHVCRSMSIMSRVMK